MRLTTKGRFAVTAMIDVAMHCHDRPVTLAAVSERQRISLSYLEQLFGKLRRHGIVDSVRGPGGGYTLAQKPESLSVADIILAVDEPIDATQCGGLENCRDDRRCMTHDLWAGLNEHIFSFLHGVTLAELVRQQQPKEVSVLHDHRHPAGAAGANGDAGSEPQTSNVASNVVGCGVPAKSRVPAAA
jgi:Rrf2 family iron-sulfur cluster assembly transcriptional regulator